MTLSTCRSWLSHVTYKSVMSHMNQSYHIHVSQFKYEWVISHIYMALSNCRFRGRHCRSHERGECFFYVHSSDLSRFCSTCDVGTTYYSHEPPHDSHELQLTHTPRLSSANTRLTRANRWLTNYQCLSQTTTWLSRTTRDSLTNHHMNLTNHPKTLTNYYWLAPHNSR